MVKTIHFILPGGGVRGSFQAGFLYELFTKHKDAFEIYKIDGTSVGSINGIASLLGEFDVLKDTWLNIKNINVSVIKLICDSPHIPVKCFIVSIIISFYSLNTIFVMYIQ